MIDSVPSWLRGAADPPAENFIATVRRSRRMRRVLHPVGTPRQAAVLVLISGNPSPDPAAPGGLPDDAEVLLTQRAATLRQHRGQVAFPGGAVDPQDAGPIDTALREATEETGLLASEVTPIAVWPTLYVPPSRFDVSPVVAYWRDPSAVRVMDRRETERVVRVPVSVLLRADHRFSVRNTLGYQSPAFMVDNLLVWGLTGSVLSGLFHSLGWELPWDTHDVRDLDTALAAVGMIR